MRRTAADGYLGDEQCETECHREDDINEQEQAATVTCGKERESPNVAQAYGTSCRRKDKTHGTTERVTVLFHFFLMYSFNYYSVVMSDYLGKTPYVNVVTNDPKYVANLELIRGCHGGQALLVFLHADEHTVVFISQPACNE